MRIEYYCKACQWTTSERTANLDDFTPSRDVCPLCGKPLTVAVVSQGALR